MSGELVARHPDEVRELERAGYTVETDAGLVAAYARHYRLTDETARAALEGNLEDVVDVDV